MFRLSVLSSVILIYLCSAFSCKQGNNEMKILYYENGNTTELKFAASDEQQLNEILNKLLMLTDDMLRVYLDIETIEELKQSEMCLEILFPEIVTLKTGFLGDVTLNKILIPLSGDYAGSEMIDSVTILIGEDDYSSGPLTASGGFKYINELKNLISDNMRP